MNNSKILFLLSSNLFHRNYVETGVIDSVSSKFDEVVILADESVKEINSERVLRYSYPVKRKQRHFQFLKILSWRHRKLSKTFKFRFYRVAQYTKIKLNTKQLIEGIKANLSSAIRRLKIISLGSRMIFPIANFIFRRILSPYSLFTEILQKERPDLIVIPSSAYDPAVLDVLNSSKKLGIKTLMLIDNWDNLSSKSVLWVHSDRIAVWGPQTAEHAQHIQGFNPDSISCIGTPRFDGYFQYRDQELRSHFDFKYILFVGQSLPADEFSILKNVNDLIQSDENLKNSIKLVYRPHPWAMHRDPIDLSSLSSVVLDPQIEYDFSSSDEPEKFQPSLAYYPSLLKNSEFVISMLTSMLIEASIFRKRVIAICHEELDNYTSPHRLLTEYVHFEGISKLPNITLSGSHQELTSCCRQWLTEGYVDIDDSTINRELDYFLKADGGYSQRLNSVIKNTIE